MNDGKKQVHNKSSVNDIEDSIRVAREHFSAEDVESIVFRAKKIAGLVEEKDGKDSRVFIDVCRGKLHAAADNTLVVNAGEAKSLAWPDVRLQVSLRYDGVGHERLAVEWECESHSTSGYCLVARGRSEEDEPLQTSVYLGSAPFGERSLDEKQLRFRPTRLEGICFSHAEKQ